MLIVSKICPGGGTGRRRGLKIPWGNTPCRFDSGPGHQAFPDISILTGPLCTIPFHGISWHFMTKLSAICRQFSGNSPAERRYSGCIRTKLLSGHLQKNSVQTFFVRTQFFVRTDKIRIEKTRIEYINISLSNNKG